MSTCLSLKKRFMELITNSKGFSSVIGTTFMVLVMMFLGTSVFLWTLSQNTIYNEEVRARNLEEAERIEEHVVATLIGNYTVSGNSTAERQVSFSAELTNTGSVAVQIIRLWVFGGDPSNPRYADKSFDLKLNPGDVLNVDSSDTTVHLPGAGVNDTFVSWFVTARGNTIPLEPEREEDGVINAQVAQGIGSVAMDFDTFVYYEVNGHNLQVWPDGEEGYYVPAYGYIAFRVNLTNFDPHGRIIHLSSHSAIWMIFRTDNPQQPRSMWWHIVNVDNSGSIVSTTKGSFEDIIIPYAQSRMIYFASDEDLSEDNFSPAECRETGPAAVNLMLFGTIGNSTYGQNIPFVSVYCS